MLLATLVEQQKQRGVPLLTHAHTLAQVVLNYSYNIANSANINVCVIFFSAAIEETYSKSMSKLAKMASNGSPQG